MSARIEIKLTEVRNQKVDLNSMSSEALESFMSVMNSLKVIAESMANKDSLSFSIESGSAVCAINAVGDEIKPVFNEINNAVQGKSTNKIFTDNLRNIQNHLKDGDFKYNFFYQNGIPKTDLAPKLISASRIAIKRKRNDDFIFKPLVLRGFFNQIGGKEPNYHFDYGQGSKIVVSCNQDDARLIVPNIYKHISTLVICKCHTSNSSKSEYFHKILISEDIAPKLKTFIDLYNSEKNLIEKLSLIYDFIDNSFISSNSEAKEILKILLVTFNDSNLHLSEVKTLLVISKPFKDEECFKEIRNNLIETYNKMKDNG